MPMTAGAVAHLPNADSRISEILVGARRAFAEKGFDGASMQDLARAAGMSVGNFYRYFPSKAALVEAFITHDLIEVEAQFETLASSPHPMEALREGLHQRVHEGNCDGHGQLWAEITAAALRKPEIAEIMRHMENSIVSRLVGVFALATGSAVETARARYTAHSQLIMMLVKGCAMSSAAPEARADLAQLIIRSIDRTLDEIASDAPKG